MAAAEWHVQYCKNSVQHIVMLPTPEQAIEFACRFLDDGSDVFGIGMGDWA